MEGTEAVEVAEVAEAPELAEAPQAESESADHSSRVAPPGEEGQEAPEGTEDGEGGEEPAIEEKLFEVKVEGKLEKVNEEELLRGYSANKVATKRFQEAARIKQEAQQIIERAEHALLTNPAGVLQQIGPEGIENAILGLLESTDPTVQAAIDRAVKASNAGPEAKRQRELERENRLLKQQSDQYRTQHEQRQQVAQQNQIREQFTQLSSGALESAGLPANETTVRELALTYQQVFPNGEPISPETVAHAAKTLANEKLPTMTNAYLESLPPEKLAELLGPERLKGLTQSQIEKVKAQQSQAPVKRPPKQAGNGSNRRFSLEELRDMRSLDRYK